jgi:hypothetical protein
MRSGSHFDHAICFYGRGPSLNPKPRPRSPSTLPYAVTQRESTIALLSRNARGR